VRLNKKPVAPFGVRSSPRYPLVAATFGCSSGSLPGRGAWRFVLILAVVLVLESVFDASAPNWSTNLEGSRSKAWPIPGAISGYRLCVLEMS